VQIGTFVALGDSFTEGLDDPRADQAGYLGWADRFAQLLAAQQPGLRYANLAIRGKVLAQVAEEQVPQAIAMAPDLVSLAAGGNDLLKFRSDPDALAQAFDDVVTVLLMAGCQVVIFTGFDPRFPVLRLIRGKVAAYNMHLRAIAGRPGCHVVDLWAMSVLRDPRAWSADRLHLTPDAHRRVALRTCEVLGVDCEQDWRAPWPASDAVTGGVAASGRAAWLAARRMDLRWAREHAAPWAARRVRGISSGDKLDPKRPELLPL
jgi:lysophospholipase L1-like esterase